ncbi:MAG: glycosyltransferase [bacterium]
MREYIPECVKDMVPENVRETLMDIKVSFLDRPVRNFFKRDYPKCVLISYIAFPFRKGIKLSHTNTRESIEIARVFDGLGFRVDVADYRFRGALDYSRYDVIFGFGEPLIRSYYKRNNDILTIFYGTGMHVCHQNHATLKRIEEVYHKKGVWLLESGRIVDKSWSVQTTLADAIITLGNEVVAGSYRKYFRKKIYLMPVTYYKIVDFREVVRGKDFSEARKHYLWFGSSGLIHKGLDLLLEIFKQLPERHLHICGPIDREPKFKRCYSKELYGTGNIHTYGFVDLSTRLFKKLVKRCGFVIFPSCSEGEASSVINVMANAGLIPIVTRESGIPGNGFGIRIQAANEASIRQALDEAMLLSPRQLEERSYACAVETSLSHSLDAFSEKLKSTLRTILDEWRPHSPV